ncbi:MAG: divalent metal cation transporter [Pseudonocardiales bacterium]|nr:divalent metal cation transporter [Pseudonocardiales bacterium]MBV9028933.1 divalent metal cation transporter [Pseudonocardiales bacterium]
MLDRDVIGALGRLKEADVGPRRSWRRRIRTLLTIMGPGLIVMGGGNDAGGVVLYAQAGQDYGTTLIWALVILTPVLYLNQEMVIRLGAVSGVGHARLIFERFGKFWGWFSVADLLVINAVTIVLELIGVSQALAFVGLPRYVSVPVAAVALFVMVAQGTFRRWERLLFLLVAVDLVVFPMGWLVHPSLTQLARGVLPSLPGGLNATLLLLLIGLIGTTVEPWQLFFQQSTVVDKRITSRWVRYERADLALGLAVEMGGAVALMAVTAFGLAGTGLAGHFNDAATVINDLSHHGGRTVAVLFAVVLLDGSLIGANLVGLTSAYTLGDALHHRSSLHHKAPQAPLFYGYYAGVIAVAAVVALLPGLPLGLLTDGVEALTGVLLPATSVFLVLLCNDAAVLGPWVNQTWKNIVTGIVVWALLLLSFVSGASTLFPELSATTIEIGLVTGAGIGLAAAALVGVARWWAARTQAAGTGSGGVGPTLDRDLHHRVGRSSRAERRALRDRNLSAWRAPALAELTRPELTPLRRVGLTTLRVYLLIAVALIIVKIVQLALGTGPAGS